MDDRYDKIMDRTGQANIRIFHIGFGDERDNEVLDLYPLSNGMLWPMPWKKTDRFIVPSQREKILNAIKPFRSLSYDDKKMKYVTVPCATEGCNGTTLHDVHDVETLEEKDFLHEDAKRFFCEACQGSNDERTDELLDQWRRACPRIFYEGEIATDVRFFPPRAWDAIKAWGENIRTSTRSLYIHGESGVCKSRMMFELLRQYVVPRGLSFKVYAGGDFRREQEMISSTRYDKKPDRITSDSDDVDVLVFDDFGQDELSGPMRSNLRWLIDYRLSKGLRTIFLSNVRPQDLRIVFGGGISSGSIIRRILDFCDIIEVNVTKESLDKSHQKMIAAEKLRTTTNSFAG